MSKILVVKAHPLESDASRSLKILEVFLKEYQTLHPEDEIESLGLFTSSIPEIDLDILSGWDSLAKGGNFEELTKEQQQKITRFNVLNDQFLQADKIIIANPMWNLNIPTRLKAWIDTITVAGKTFKYTADGPVGLTSGKKALHIQSNGGVYAGNDFGAQYVKSIFNFIGVSDYRQLFIEGIDHQPDQEDIIMDKAFFDAKNIARLF